ncbi:MAG: pyroglutamyl-peptidase I family protein [Alphaproteobacteria bacterium]
MAAILLTGFEPFRQWAVNSSWEAVCHLAARRSDLSAGRLPVDHELAAEAVGKLIADLRPEIVLLTGLADDPAPRLERLGRAGPLPLQGGPSERPGRWPWEAARDGVAAQGVGMRFSDDAGGYVCDTTYWAALGTAARLVAFLHLPPPGPIWTPEHGARVVEAVLAAAMG